MKTILEEFAEVCGDTWREPLVSNDPLATVNTIDDRVFEWWHGSKKLTFYVEALWLLRVSDVEIHDGYEMLTAQAFLEHWKWLHE